MERRPALARALTSAAIAATVVGLASCGGSADDTAAAGATTAASVDAAPSTTMSDDPFCVEVKAAADRFGLGDTASADLTAVLSRLPEAAGALSAAAASAPEELQGDLQVLASSLATLGPAMSEMAALSQAAATDPSKQAELAEAGVRMQTELAKVQTPEFAAAFDHLSTYAAEQCGVSFS
ncbi:MAG: hypothetical protein AB7W59_10345 [Acidimicrobiia bacterium]